jgi:hypothetical protein
MDENQYADFMASQQMQQQMGQNALNTQQQLMFNEQERGLAEEQLDVEEIIDRIYNLLQGSGVKDWMESKDNQMKILSDWGVQRIMQVVRFHINKNTLLSNFDEVQINRLMYHFTTEMNDLVLLKYQKLFRETTFEECKKIMEIKLEENERIKHFNKEKIKQELLDELEGNIEKQIAKIREDERKNRIKEYGLLLWEIEQSVYSTLNRAYGGKERETLRRHASFNEIRSIQPEQQKKGGGVFGWLKS